MTLTAMDASPTSAETSSAWGFSEWTTLVCATLAAITAAVIM
eukprot:CAMPEP_0197738730 /NCGR_PEP_ID=MMETSP1435-20131217/16164_1 /TAXON_ID=426625 /ORGANISM="Chaetoceros brevis, Strain CCMP164" /LENGTH=41 /DNA_ID= /DNA_START= /DNA_END= /DNA_ORIENTATION=